MFLISSKRLALSPGEPPFRHLIHQVRSYFIRVAFASHSYPQLQRNRSLEEGLSSAVLIHSPPRDSAISFISRRYSSRSWSVNFDAMMGSQIFERLFRLLLSLSRCSVLRLTDMKSDAAALLANLSVSPCFDPRGALRNDYSAIASKGAIVTKASLSTSSSENKRATRR